MNIVTIFSLTGGLGLFLYGMKLMSEGLEKAAGARMRSILEFFTKNRFVGMLVGVLFTAIIQSSSATTVMVVSFVNSGLMTLAQAAGVIMGANIGTTVTSQLIAFNLSDVAPLFIMIGVIMVMFCQKVNVQKIGQVILGFGILFVGLSTMSGAMSSIKESPHIVSLLSSLDNSVMAIFVGFIITAILQSSSATVGIILLMATQGLLNYPICFFLILGCNIGSCVSALLASLGGKKDAKRAAWIHFLFNIIGSAVLFIVLSVAVNPIADKLFALSGGNIARAVANAHTLMKVAEVVILFPFMNLVVKATYAIVKGEDASPEDEFELKYIRDGKVISPTTASVDVIKEIEHMGKIAAENLKAGMDALCGLEEEKIEIVYQRERYIDFLNDKITNYLVKMNQMDLPIQDSEMIGGLFHVVNDIERIGDHAENFADSAKMRINDQVAFSEKGEKQLQEMSASVMKILEYSIDMFSHKNQEHMKEILQLESEIDDKEKKLLRSYVKRMRKNKCSPEAGMIFSDTISGLERVADHATNIAFAILRPEEYDDDDEEME